MFNKKYMQYKKTLGRDTIYLFLVYGQKRGMAMREGVRRLQKLVEERNGYERGCKKIIETG